MSIHIFFYLVTQSSGVEIYHTSVLFHHDNAVILREINETLISLTFASLSESHQTDWIHFYSMSKPLGWEWWISLAFKFMHICMLLKWILVPVQEVLGTPDSIFSNTCYCSQPDCNAKSSTACTLAISVKVGNKSYIRCLSRDLTSSQSSAQKVDQKAFVTASGLREIRSEKNSYLNVKVELVTQKPSLKKNKTTFD